MDAQKLQFILTLAAIFVIIFLLLFFQCFFLFVLKPRREGLIFTVTKESVGEQSGKIQEILQSLKLSSSDMSKSLLLLEEVVVRLEEHSDFAVTARVVKVFGKANICLISQGKKYNPLKLLESEKSPDSEDLLREKILAANSMKLTYKRRGKNNIVIVKVL